MALIDCKNCGHRISDKAKACPKCGSEVLARCLEPELPTQTSQVNQAAQSTQQSQTTTQPQEPEQPIESVKQAQPVVQPQQPQPSQSALELQNIEDDDEPKSSKGLIFGLVFGGIALLVVAVLCFPQLRFWENINKKDLLETAYNEGYNCGKQFGCMTRCDELFEMANSTYNSEGVVSKDDFQQQFTLGMETGVKESPYKSHADSYGNSVIDLGLSVLWGNHNIGASSSQNSGNYYTFDEAVIEIRSMGDGWRLPTKTELEELKDKCDWVWTGSGYRVTGLNGNSIYLPATGFSHNNSTKYEGELGRYWSSTMGEDNKSGLMIFNKSQIDVVMYYRNYGFSIRPVRNK